MVKVERKTPEPPPVEIIMTMDLLTARAVKAAIQIASRNNNNNDQNLSDEARQRLVEVSERLYNKNVIIQPEDVVNTKSSF